MRIAALLVLSALTLSCERSGGVLDPPKERSPLGTFTRVTMMRRVLDGGVTTSGVEVLVVNPYHTAEIHDRDAAGLVIKKATVKDEPFLALEKALASSAWSSLPRDRGTSVPDGAAYTIEVRGVRVTRRDDPGDEPVVRQATVVFRQIWAQTDP